MRALLVVLILTLGWLKLNGQTGPVFQYTNPSKQEIYNLAMEESPKGYAFRTYLLEVINEGLRDTISFLPSKINDVFNNLYFEEIYLLDEPYKNSGYNPSKKSMVPSDGNPWKGFGWVFRIGSYSIRILKGDCANILKTKVIRRFVSTPPSSKQIEREISSPPHDWRTYRAPKPSSSVVVEEQKEEIQKEVVVEVHTSKFWAFQKRNWWWEGLVLGAATGFIAHDSDHNWYLWFPKGPNNHGTMSGGRPYVDPANVVPADPGAGRGN